MEVGKIRRRIMPMFFVVWVIVFTGAGQTISTKAADGPYASDPIPADGGMVPGKIYPGTEIIYAELVFVPGSTAVKHTGYFSEDYSKVAGRVQDANLGQPPYAGYPGYDYTYFVGRPDIEPPTESLVRGRRYYWAVDETDALGNTFPGDVWEFTVQDFYAFSPSPPNEAKFVSITPILSWKAGYDGSTSNFEHDIYFGTSFDDVNNRYYDPDLVIPPPPWTQPGDDEDWDPIADGGLTIEYGTVYYWRVDEVWDRVLPFSPGTYYKGSVWSFTTRLPKIFVDIDATGANDGSSWADALNYLQDALSVALPGDVIYVAQGTYKPDLGAGITPGDRTATFQLKNGVTLKGGYAGFGEVDPNARDIEAYETILSGDLAGNDVDVNDPIDLLNEPTRADNSYHVLTGNEIDASAILDGLTITAGHAQDNKYGGGMYNHHGSPTILNCTFTKNWAEDNGGGMFNSSGSPLLVNCKFTFNATSEDDDDEGGSGIFNDGSSPMLLNCVFIGNWADFRGGGMYNKYSNPTLTNCTFSKNWAEMGGAVYNYRDTDEEDYSPTLNNCTFSGNSANTGGAMYNRESSTTLTNCTFSVNLADNNGGGMYNYNSNPMVTNCIFWGNIDFSGVDETAQIYNHSGAPVINYCCVQGWTGTLDGIGNIGDDPLFVDADGIDNIVGTEDDNLRLLAGSPCIDAGDNSVVTVTTDLDGNPRIINGIVDMGAYEFQGPFKQYYHVDGVNGNNTNDGLTPETAFKTIQRGINVAEDFDTVLVWPGVYNEEIAFWGDAITVKSAADAAIVETDYGYAFSFFSAEGHDTVLSNFVIRNSQYGIYLINGSSPTLRNLTIVNNDFGISAFNGADPDISSCIFWNNFYGHLFREPVPLQAKYSFVQEEVSEPIAHWKFDDGSGSTAKDSAGTNNGTLIGDPTWTAGRIGGALSFDGDGDYVEFASIAALEGDSLTALAWIRVDESAIIWNPVIMQHDLNNNGYHFYIVNKKPSFCVVGDDGSIFVKVISPETINADKWYHVAGTNDGTNLKLYVNGQLKDSKESSGLTGVNYNAYIGFEPISTLCYKGLIDDVRIYDRALSAGEIEAIYEVGLAGISYGEPGFVDANGGDYHLLSERGRYWPAHDVWVLDDATSPCIDGGDPTIDPSNERMPNGGRINMGAYGNSAYASMSEWPIKGDVNNDGRFNFVDIAILLDEWLEELDWAE